jgi:hypothetical protein
MATQESSATSARTNTREDRARDLAERHFHEIAASKDGHEYLVPSCTGAHVYRVYYDPEGESRCQCPDHEIRGAVCKHLLAVALVVAELRRRGGRFIRLADLEQISEWTGISYFSLSSAFTGERKNLCLDVVKAAISANRDGDPEDWGESVRWWAKASGRGCYRADDLEDPKPAELQGV